MSVRAKTYPAKQGLKPWRLKLSTAVLLAIGSVDLVSTMVWLENGGREGNPTFERLWEYGPLHFVAGKFLFLLGPIVILEIVRQYRSRTAEQGTWIAAGAYLFLWLGQVLRLAGGI